MRHDTGSHDLMRAAATQLARVDRMLICWVIVAAALAIAAMVCTSRPAAVKGQTGPALTPSAPIPAPPSEEIAVFVASYAGGAEVSERSRTTVRVVDVSTLESSPSRRRLPLTGPTAADRFIDATLGGQPLIGLQISVGATGRGTLPASLTRAQLAGICFPASMRPPGVNMESLAVNPGRLVKAQLNRHALCVEFVFTEPGVFVVGTRTKPVLPEFAALYASTGGEATWGPCLTHGFFAAVGPAGTIVEASRGSGVYMQICANGVLGYHPELAGTGYEIQPVLATHWVRGEDGQFVGPDPPATNSGEGRYFPQTGHNVSGAFLTSFLALGGVEVLGYPITEAVPAAPGFTDQYFQHLKLRMDDATETVTIRPVGREFIAMLAASRPVGTDVP